MPSWRLGIRLSEARGRRKGRHAGCVLDGSWWGGAGGRARARLVRHVHDAARIAELNAADAVVLAAAFLQLNLGAEIEKEAVAVVAASSDAHGVGHEGGGVALVCAPRDRSLQAGLHRRASAQRARRGEQKCEEHEGRGTRRGAGAPESAKSAVHLLARLSHTRIVLSDDEVQKTSEPSLGKRMHAQSPTWPYKRCFGPLSFVKLAQSQTATMPSPPLPSC